MRSPETPIPEVNLENVRSYWDASPLCASAIPHPLGTAAYFAYYDKLRERNEPVAFASELHEYERFSGRKVLDVGCSNGYVLSRYARAGAETYGVDLTDAAVYRWRCPIVSRLTGKSMQQLVNEVDGVGNPKGDVYTRAEARQLLAGFNDIEMLAGLLRGTMLVPRIGRVIPDSLLRPFERLLGWFLYIKASKPGQHSATR